MDSRDKRGNNAVDDILEELKSKGGSAPKTNDRQLDDLLSSMGLGSGQSVLSSVAARSAAAPAKPANSPAPRAVPAPPPAPAPKAPPPQQAQTTVFAAPPKAPAAQNTPPQADTLRQMSESIPQQTAGWKMANKAEAPRKVKPGDATSIWDLEAVREPGAPRMGKAAALNRVDPDKFTGDSELLNYFAQEDEIPLSKKDQRKADKAQRKEEAAQRKRAKSEGYEDEGEFLAMAAPDEMIDPGETDEDEAWSHQQADEVVTGSAFDEALPEEDWRADGSLFDAGRGRTEQDDTRVLPDLHAETHGHPPAYTEGDTAEFFPESGHANTRAYDLDEIEAEPAKVPTAAYTQEFDSEAQAAPLDETVKNLYVDEMVDDRFREFFSETVIVNRDEVEQGLRGRGKKKARNKSRTALLTGEFAQMAEQAEAYEDEDFDDYNRPQDAEQVEKDIVSLRTTLTRRTVLSVVFAVLLGWLALAFSSGAPVPAAIHPTESPLAFALLYLGLVVAVVMVNFTTLATGLVGLAGQPTSDSPPALAAVAALLQALVFVVQMIISSQGTTEIQAAPPPAVTLFGAVMALVLAFNTLGKRIRVRSVLDNFQLASAGFDHSAAYVLDNSNELACHITKGLEEEAPALLISRPTALVKGFLRQSFSQRLSDNNGRILGWVLTGVALLAGIITYFISGELLVALSAVAAVFCIGAPFSSTLVAAVPSALLQQSTSKVGAVVPGWSAIEELGEVNVVMAGSRDIFPPSSVYLKGIKTFQKERVDLAILYAASVLIEGCDTLRDIFLGVIQGKSDMLYKVESLAMETGRGFTAWVQNSRVVIGTREMLQKYDIDPPPIEIEMKYATEGYMPVYLAVAGKLFAMFIVGYRPDPEVKVTLEGLVRSGVSLMITSEDMNVTGALIEQVYALPAGVIKVMSKRDLELMEPLTAYLPESEGVMTHIGTFTSFIGGMRAAAGCAASERMSGIVQIASVALAALLCMLLVFSGSLAQLNLTIVLLYQLGWTVLVSALPFARRY